MPHETREAWLEAAVSELRPLFDVINRPLPEKVRVSTGFPSTNALTVNRRRIGECWHGSETRDGVSQVFISPLIDDPIEVLAIVAHELVHVALGPNVGHRPPFMKVASALGLEGRPTATVAGSTFRATATDITLSLGVLPHAAISPTMKERKSQVGRMLKVECGACGYVARVTRKWLDDAGAPICPTDGVKMEEE